MGKHIARLMELYFGGDMEAAIPLSGQVAGRIDAVKTAREIVEETVEEFHASVRSLAQQYQR
jgi:enoyl-[acyl-carrier protein] reductase II